MEYPEAMNVIKRSKQSDYSVCNKREDNEKAIFTLVSNYLSFNDLISFLIIHYIVFISIQYNNSLYSFYFNIIIHYIVLISVLLK